jgi:hypothetical protein
MNEQTELGPKSITPSTMPHGILVSFCLLLMTYGLFTPNPLETAWFACMLIILMRMWMWKQYPAILLYLFAIQFIESHTSLFEANNYGITLNELFPGSGKQTWWMASLGLLSMMVGTQVLLQRARTFSIPSFEHLQRQAERISQTRLLLCILSSHGLASLVDRLIPYGSSLAQFETYSTGIPNALTLAFGIHFFLTRKRPLLVFGLFLYLLVTSFYSYFSSWREPLVLVFICYFVSIKKVGTRELTRLGPILIPSLALVLIWQAVKGEYREFISGGREDQSIRVSQSEALDKFVELGSTALYQNQTLEDPVISATYRRAGYLEYFSAAVTKVPVEIPHQKGALLTESLSFSLIPRILNPNKGVKRDREKVERFTDYYFGGERNISSFSLGHYCEAYIDWGPNGMMVHLFIYGIIGGVLIVITTNRTRRINPILAFGILWVVLTPWGTFQQDMVTISGRVFWGSICHLVLFFPLYRKIQYFITRAIN